MPEIFDINIDLTNAPIYLNNKAVPLFNLEDHVDETKQIRLGYIIGLIKESSKFQKALNIPQESFDKAVTDLHKAKTITEAYLQNPDLSFDDAITYTAEIERNLSSFLTLCKKHIKEKPYAFSDFSGIEGLDKISQLVDTFKIGTQERHLSRVYTREDQLQKSFNHLDIIQNSQFFSDCTQTVTFKGTKLQSGSIIGFLPKETNALVCGLPAAGYQTEKGYHIQNGNELTFDKNEQKELTAITIKKIDNPNNLFIKPANITSFKLDTPIKLNHTSIVMFKETFFYPSCGEKNIFLVEGKNTLAPDIIISRSYRRLENGNIIRTSIRYLLVPEAAFQTFTEKALEELIKAVKEQSTPFGCNLNYHKPSKTSTLYEHAKFSLGQLYG